MSIQTTNTILMVRPARFQFNFQTAVNNAFQKQLDTLSPAEIEQQAIAEFDGFVSQLRQNGVNVIVIDDTPEPAKPDAIFPNNWVSFHADGNVFLYPMNTPNRRLERRADIIEKIQTEFQIHNVTDLSPEELNGKILEGTGSIVFDHTHAIAYACLSPRTELSLFIHYCEIIGYQPVYFTSVDEKGGLVYHTNVVMCMGEGFVVICLDSVKDAAEREMLVEKFAKTNTEIVAISLEQMNQFAGNMLQVRNDNGDALLVMSQTAYDALTPSQLAVIQKHAQSLPVSIPTIETIGGGSARCMMAEIFCPKK